ncbi:MAG: hypothetical protein PUP92_28790 [Rhizonema sp. PD38]|nr:hypothetical protein [Rhizonema sp. PD38]
MTNETINYETIIELGGHMSKRNCLTKEDLREIQQIYNQILDAWIALRQCGKKADNQQSS